MLSATSDATRSCASMVEAPARMDDRTPDYCLPRLGVTLTNQANESRQSGLQSACFMFIAPFCGSASCNFLTKMRRGDHTRVRHKRAVLGRLLNGMITVGALGQGIDYLEVNVERGSTHSTIFESREKSGLVNDACNYGMLYAYGMF